jgi:hypothetical protein
MNSLLLSSTQQKKSRCFHGGRCEIERISMQRKYAGVGYVVIIHLK